METVLCFGEVLWDCLPRGLFLGGAPCNVAYHLNRRGVRASVVSAVGDDFLGHEIKRRVRGWGVDTSFLATNADLPTGTVQVELVGGSPKFEIVEGVAWDRIPVTDELLGAARSADAIVYGSLALRTEHNRAAADRLLAAARGLKALDINLRPPYIDPAVFDFAIRRADLVKLNDDELAKLIGDDPTPGPSRSDASPSGSLRLAISPKGDLHSPSGNLPLRGGRALGRGRGAQRGKGDGADIETQAAAFARAWDISQVCVTCGARGAGFWRSGAWHWEAARPVAVRDTVGAGDAFLAGLLTGLLRGKPDAECLADACRAGELVAGSDGATPEYSVP